VKVNELHKEPDAVALALVASGGLPLAVFVALRGQYAAAVVAAFVGATGLWIVVEAVRHVLRVRVARRARALSATVMAAIAARVGPPPAVIRVAAWACYLLAGAAMAFAVVVGVGDGLANLASVLVIVVVLVVAVGFVLSGRRLTRQGEANTLYVFADGLGMIGLGAIFYGFDTYGLTRWGELTGFAVATAVLFGLGLLPAIGSGARWRRRQRAAAAAHRARHPTSTVDQAGL
jgi:hypothetical protein